MTSSKKTKLHIIKKRTNNKVSFVKFILDSWQLLKVVILTFLLVFQHVYFCQSFDCWR